MKREGTTKNGPVAGSGRAVRAIAEVLEARTMLAGVVFLSTRSLVDRASASLALNNSSPEQPMPVRHSEPRETIHAQVVAIAAKSASPVTHHNQKKGTKSTGRTSSVAKPNVRKGTSPAKVTSDPAYTVSVGQPKKFPATWTAALASLPSRESGKLTASGLEISIAPQHKVSTPGYVLLNKQPGVSKKGVLEPFATAAPTGLTVAKVRHAYGIDQVMFGNVQGDGTGQTIAIVDAYDYPTALTDLHAFDLAMGLPDPPSLTRVNETGGSTLPGTDPSGKGSDWEVEEALDVEWAHAMAPQANILLVEATSATDADLMQNAVNYARSAPGVVAVTMSFGRAEGSTDTSLNSNFTTPTGHSGVTFLASTGDAAAPGEYPAYSPNVVAVGGTTLNVDGSGNYVSESGWADGGGGVSSYETQPTYQKGVVTQSTTQRTIPDISYDADPASGVSIYDSYDFGTTTPWLTVGGTSVSSPCWAGLIAVADQGLALSGSTSLNGSTQTLPLLYKLPAADFHDITSGNNGNSAGVGYDLVTGIGSPVANLLIPGLVQAANPYEHVVATSPAAGAGVFGAAPVSFTVTLSNTADPSTLQASDFTVNGIVPAAVTLDATNTIVTLTYASSPVTTPGTQTLSVAAGAIKRLSDETANTAYSGTFFYESTQLQVTSSTPNSATQPSLPLTTMTVNFNQAVNPASVSATSLTLSLGTVTNAVLSNGNTSITYTLSGITTEAYITASIAAGALTDAYGAPCGAFTTTFATHLATNALPAATAVVPLGSQIYQSLGNGIVGIPSDAETFTIPLVSGEIATVVVHPTNSLLRPAVTLLDPSNNVLGQTSASGSGQDAVIQATPVTSAGTYTLQVTGNASSTGAFSVQVLLNSAVESAEHGGAPDTSIASAQNLDAAFNTINSAAAMASVLGALNVTTSDYYAVTLQAGQTLSAALTSISGTGTPTLALLNSSGVTLATGTTGATNVNLDIAQYVAPATGIYYLLASGSAGINYSLVVTKNAAFSLQPHNSFATAQNITGTADVVGALSNTGGQVDTVTASNVGWWNSTGAHTSGNSNYLTGIGSSGSNYNSYYVFSLAGIAGPIAAATLNAYNPSNGYSSANSTEALGLFDVSTPIATLEAGGTGQTSIFTDLGSGVSYGTNTVSAASDGTTVSTTLNSAAVNAINSNLGNTFAIGGSLPLVTGTASRYVFGFTGSGATPTLTLTLGGGADWYSLNVTSTGQPIVFSTATPGGTSGQFTNTLDPHIEVFDPNDNLVASGVKLADGRNELVNYQPLTTGTYRIEVLPQNNTAGEYELNQGNALSLNLPANVRKGDGIDTGTITVTSAPASDLTISLASTDPSRLSVPATVTIPAGQTSASVPLTVVDDHLLDGPEIVSVSALASGYFGAAQSVDVHDNQTATLNVSLPSTAVKGQGIISGTITSSVAPAQNIVIQLSSSNSSELSAPTTVTLPAGQTSVTFNANVLQDALLDGTQNVSVTAAVDNWTTGSASVAIADDNNTISVSLPTSGWEGQTLTAGGTITLGGKPTSNVVVNLQSSNPAELSVPATVTIPAGSATATFNVTLLNDSVKHGPLAESVSATSTGLSSGMSSITVHDSTLDHLVVTPIAGPEAAGVAFNATVTAYNIANEAIATYAGTGTLSASGQNGTLAVSPTSVTFTGGVWTGSVTINALDPAAVLTIASGGLSASSNAFAISSGALSKFVWNTIGATQNTGVPFAASLTAEDANGYAVTSFNGTATLSALAGTTTSQTMLGSPTYTNSANYGTFTVGYAFTPNTTIQVTSVRSFFGTKVSFWTNTGTLLTSQAVSGSATTWTETPLNNPITLQAGTTYRITVLTGGQTYYWRNVAPVNPSFATLGQTYEVSGDAFPTNTDAQYWLVDLRGNVSTSASVPVTPTTATFVNGVWSGNVTVAQAGNGVHLHIDDGNGHTADSNTFNVTTIPTSLTVNIPTSGWEGQTLTNAGTVTINGTLPTALTVNLTSADPTALTVPATVTIPAGQSSATFTVTLPANPIKQGTRAESVSATATGLSNGSGNLTLHDSDLDHLVITPITGPQAADVPFTQTITAYNIANEAIATYTGTGTLSASGQGGVLPVSPTSVTFANGVWTGSVAINALDPAAVLTITSGGLSASSNAFAISSGALSKFVWNTIGATQNTGIPFAATLTAEDANGYPVTSYNGTATLSGLTGSTTSQTMLNGGTSYTNGGAGSWTDGYAFTPNTNITVTAVRSFYGAKISIWTSTGTLVTSQVVTGTAGTWTETPLTTPVTLTAGTTYRIGSYSNGGAYYYSTTVPTNPSFATLGQSYYSSGDAFPTTSESVYIPADLRCTVGAFVSVPITPTTATFVNGVWSGNVTVAQAGNGVHLHIDDGNGHTADSNTFNVFGTPAAPILAAATDSGYSNSDGITNFNNSSAAKAPQFTVTGTVSGATVTVYADGTAIGSAVATGNSTTVTANGTTVLSDGAHAITAAQTSSTGTQSGLSSATSITIDTAPPTAALASAPNVTTAGGTSYTFTVALGDNNAIDTTSLTSSNMLVTGPNSFSQLATFVSVSPTGNGTPRTATYSITPPGGSWIATADGTYSIALQSGQVKDVAGNPAAAGTLGTFSVTVPLTAPTSVALAAATDSGTSSSDGITNFNNSSTAKAPQFVVAGTVNGATVAVYADGNLIGTAIASGTSATVTADGKTVLADGVHSITARQTVAGQPQTGSSPATTITILTVAPPAPPAPVLEAGSDSGESNSDGITNVTSPTLDVTATQAGILHLALDGTNTISRQVTAAGTYPIVLAGGGGSSSFGPEVQYSTSGASTFGTVADFNGDGRLDVVTSGLNSFLNVLLDNKDGTLQADKPRTLGAAVGDVTSGDVNGDGKLDLISAGLTRDAVSICLGNGDGTFQPETLLSTGYSCDDVAVGDFNGDGKLDIVADSVTSGTVSILLGNGNGTFQAPKTISGIAGGFIKVADLNGDGKADLVIAGTTSPTLTVLLGNGDGTFQSPITTSLNGTAKGQAIADLNGDGKLDDAVATSVGCEVFLGNGNGTFQTPQIVSSPSAVSSIAVADFNRDGKPDILLGETYSGFAVSLGNGDGTFQPYTVTATHYQTYAVLAGDLNGDGAPDVSIVTGNAGVVSVFLNTGTAPIANGAHTITAWQEDLAGNASPVSVSLPITIDTQPPTVASFSAPAPTSGSTSSTFTVTFADNISLSVASLNSNDIVVTGPNGFSAAATFVSVNVNTDGTPRTATYSIPAPGGTWTAADNGTYSLVLQAGQVADVAGNTIAGSTIGTFNVALAKTTAFSGLSGPTSLVYGTASVSFSGTIGAGGLFPPTSENVAVTLNGVTINAPINASGQFTATFNTALLPASATPYQVSYSYAGDAGFAAVSDTTSTTLTINKAVPTITAPIAPPSITYDGTSDVTNWLGATVTGVTGATAPTGAVTWLFYNGSSPNNSPLPAPPVNAGTYTVVGTYLGDGNYTAVSSSPVTFTINRAPVTVTLPPPPPNLVYDGSSDITNWVQATVAGPGGAPAPTGEISYSYYLGNTATGTPLNSAPTGAGTYTVVASYGGNSNYLAGTSAPTTFTITRGVRTADRLLQSQRRQRPAIHGR